LVEEDESAGQQPNIQATIEQLYYNYEFTLLFKDVYSKLVHILALPPGAKLQPSQSGLA